MQVTCVKQAEDGKGLIVRLCNSSDETQEVAIVFGQPITKATQCHMDESKAEPMDVKNNRMAVSMSAKKIVTLRIV